MKSHQLKIGKPGSAGRLAIAIMPSTAGKPITVGPPATVSWKETSEMIASPGMPAIAERPATVTHQELKGRQQHKYWYVM